MRRILFSVLMLMAAASVHAADAWKLGQHYVELKPAKPTNVAPGKIEVLEVFSYGCPYCYQLYPFVDQLKASLPKSAEVCYLPASFIPAESWPLFQRAYYTADALGLVDKTHGAMFDAIWKTGELAIVDFRTNRLKRPAPTIEDAAAFYSRVAKVKPSDFLAAAKSFSVTAKMQRADYLVKSYPVDETPTFIINGKYKLTPTTAGGFDKVIELVKFLVAKESAIRR